MCKDGEGAHRDMKSGPARATLNRARRGRRAVRTGVKRWAATEGSQKKKKKESRPQTHSRFAMVATYQKSSRLAD